MNEQEKLAEYNGPDKIISSHEVEELLNLDKKKDFSIKSGIESLDYYTEGFRGGELVIISGPTGDGKTLLCQTITEYLANHPENVVNPLWFSFEMPPRQFLRCFPVVPYFYLPAELKPYKWDWFMERCKENEVKHDGRVIIIDHLHFLLDFFQTKNPSLEIGRMVRMLKRLAVDNEYIVFLVAHISKIGEGTQASMRNIRDSSFITQEADTVIMVQRIIDGQHNEARLTIDKCRYTGAFNKSIEIQKVGGYLEEMA